MVKFFKAIFYGFIGWVVFNFILFFGASFYLTYMGVEGELSATLTMVLRYASIALGVLMGIIPLLGGGRRASEVREVSKMPQVAFRPQPFASATPQPPGSSPAKPTIPPFTVAPAPIAPSGSKPITPPTVMPAPMTPSGPKPAPLVLPKPSAPVPPPVMGTPFKPVAPQPVIPTPPKPPVPPPLPAISAPPSGSFRPTEFSLRPSADSIKPPAPPPASLPVVPKPPILSVPAPAPFKPATPVPPVFQPPSKPFTPIFGAPQPKPPAGTPSDVHSTWPPRSV